MRSGSTRLRTQLSRSMIFTALTALSVFSLGMLLFYAGLQETWLRSLTADNRQTLETLLDDGAVSAEALTTLISTFSFSWGGGYALAELTAFGILIVVAALCAMLIGTSLSRRLSAPIETVTDAALQIAGGNFTLALADMEGGARETEELISAFRTMTRALESAERETTESSAAIAHELRTPLTILRGRLQGLSDGAFEPSRKMTDGLLAQVDTLAKIVDDLGLLSRLSTGKLHLQLTTMDLAEEVERVLTPVRPDLETLGFEIVMNLQAASMQGDPERIRQVIAALVENVRRYASDGLYLRLSTRMDARETCLEIADRGPGIDPAHCEKIFERWWRSEPSRNRAQGGTGLGLPIVKSLVEAHGGRVSAYNNGDGGMTVTAFFPHSPSA